MWSPDQNKLLTENIKTPTVKSELDINSSELYELLKDDTAILLKTHFQ